MQYNNFYMGVENSKDLEFEKAVDELIRAEREETERLRYAQWGADIGNPQKLIGAQ